jgi:thymidylate kinase
MSLPPIVALDGHDASGKTTLSRRLAAVLGGRAVRPFAGQRGADMLHAAESGDKARALEIAREAVSSTLAEHSDAPVLVCDRLWLTVFTLVPEELQAKWPFFAPTALCSADLETTLARLKARDEAPEPALWHTRYMEQYLRLAQRWGAFVLRTDRSTEDESLAALVEWARPEIERQRAKARGALVTPAL